MPTAVPVPSPAKHPLPVLEAAHIRPYAQAGTHDVRNGLLLRSDLHRLFDIGYVTVTPDLHLEVRLTATKRFRERADVLPAAWDRGHRSAAAALRPDAALLGCHAEHVYRS